MSAVEQGPATRGGGASRTRLWFLWHSWLAMPVWAFLFFVCLTGTIAVVSTEIMWLIDPALRASGSGTPLPVSALIAAAEDAAPGARAAAVSWGGSHMAVGVELFLPGGTEATAWVNPVTGIVQGMSGHGSFRGFIRALHGWLLTYPTGWYAVTALAVPMVGSLVTGLVVYKRFWRAFLHPRLRWGQGARVLWGDLHRLTGVWSIWFIAVIAMTSLWFLIYVLLLDLGMGLGGRKPPVLLARDTLPVAQAAPPVDMDAVMAAARAAVPGMRLRYLIIPETAFEPVLVIGSGGQAPLLPDRVLVNPHTAAVMDVTGGLEGASGIELTRTVMRALHTGDFGGLPVKLVWLVFGILLTGMVFSGMMIWIRRTARVLKEGRALKEGRHG